MIFWSAHKTLESALGMIKLLDETEKRLVEIHLKKKEDNTFKSHIWEIWINEK